jgi:geranylgeranyl pyrophosphate synthase
MRDRLPAEESQALRDALAGKTEADVPYWLAKLREMGIFEEVRQAIFDEIAKGRAAIQSFDDNPSAAHLRTISELLWNQVDAL